MDFRKGELQEIAIGRAQLRSALSNLSVSLIANVFIAGSAALIIYKEQDNALIFLWFAIVVLLNVVRLGYGISSRRHIEETETPHHILRRLATFALIGGSAWVPLTVYFLPAIETRTAAYIVFIMAGIATGAIIQSLAYWRISIAFGGPILSATILGLLLQGQAIDYVVAVNVLLLMAMLFRIAILSEANFRNNQATTLEATELAQSLQNANDEVQKANETLRRLATTDPLTGLPNRSVFNQRLATLLHAKAPVALALIDIDHFKQINDNSGHAAGDDILCSLALSMLDNAGEHITPIRLGGDEFALIADGPGGLERLKRCTDQLRKDLREFGRSRGLPTATISVGLCSDETGSMTAADLFSETDRALYAAKGAGRNCVRTAPANAGISRSA
jgi:diguanylate cyclase (GGDEF)-like protein